MSQIRGNRKVRQGIVVSDKMEKTIVVNVERYFKHPTYKKYIRRHKKYMAHDELNQCHIGDIVQIIETKPMSKQKCWRLSTVVVKAPEAR